MQTHVGNEDEIGNKMHAEMRPLLLHVAADFVQRQPGRSPTSSLLKKGIDCALKDCIWEACKLLDSRIVEQSNGSADSLLRPRRTELEDALLHLFELGRHPCTANSQSKGWWPGALRRLSSCPISD